MKKWLFLPLILFVGLTTVAKPLPVKHKFVDAVITYTNAQTQVFDGIAWVSWIDFGHTSINQTYSLHYKYQYQINGVGPVYESPWHIEYVHTYDNDWDFTFIISMGNWPDGPVEVPIPGTVQYRFGPFSD